MPVVAGAAHRDVESYGVRRLSGANGDIVEARTTVAGGSGPAGKQRSRISQTGWLLGISRMRMSRWGGGESNGSTQLHRPPAKTVQSAEQKWRPVSGAAGG